MRGTVSKIKLYKACEKAYYFKYVEKLEPVQKAEALETGTAYHELLEQLYNTGELPAADYSKELAMATAYQKYVYPKLRVQAVEEWVEKPCGKHILLGRVDGIAEDGAIVEHKTTSLDLEEFEYGLQWDEQMLVYMWLTDTQAVWYTICRKPTIRQKKDETDEEFFERMVAWYDEDTDSKIRVVRLTRTKAQIAECITEMQETMDDMENAGRIFRKNTCYCNHWGRECDYANICLNYDPNENYIEFVKGVE